MSNVRGIASIGDGGDPATRAERIAELNRQIQAGSLDRHGDGDAAAFMQRPRGQDRGPPTSSPAKSSSSRPGPRNAGNVNYGAGGASAGLIEKNRRA
jgi:hypothetical protein